eukprot:11205019-Lingulodinium_polyedra.AAC.1
MGRATQHGRARPRDGEPATRGEHCKTGGINSGDLLPAVAVAVLPALAVAADVAVAPPVACLRCCCCRCSYSR